mmetsp:Transcript_108588/g.302807  ORF Transcript_108588/g.302807 Transcript_108588/m.302807 type:complete len:82 (-) Transcript_108588:184-429(-)
MFLWISLPTSDFAGTEKSNQSHLRISGVPTEPYSRNVPGLLFRDARVWGLELLSPQQHDETGVLPHEKELEASLSRRFTPA